MRTLARAALACGRLFTAIAAFCNDADTWAHSDAEWRALRARSRRQRRAAAAVPHVGGFGG